MTEPKRIVLHREVHSPPSPWHEAEDKARIASLEAELDKVSAALADAAFYRPCGATFGEHTARIAALEAELARARETIICGCQARLFQRKSWAAAVCTEELMRHDDLCEKHAALAPAEEEKP